MEIWKHALFSSILAVIFYPIFGWKVLLILAGGTSIDIDHYFWYIRKYKKFGLLSCYMFLIETEKNKWKDVIGSLFVFHTIEFMLFIMLLSFYNQLALMFAIGLFSHYLLDAIFLYTVPKRVILNHSIIWWTIKNKIQKRFKIQKV